MIEIAAFRCTDGTLKTSKFEALTHERNIRLKDVFLKAMGNNSTMMTVQQAAAITGNTFKTINEIYMECEKALNHMAMLQRRRENAAKRKAAKKLQVVG
jgi:hypothetical protein